MSKVKAPLEEAREFASSPKGIGSDDEAAPRAAGTNISSAAESGALVVAADGGAVAAPPELPDAGKAATRGHTLIADAANNNEPVAYSCEQERMNYGLRAAVLSLEADTVKGALRLKEIFDIAFENFNDGILPRHKAVTDYKSMFQSPPVAVGEPQQILFDTEEDVKAPLYAVEKVYAQFPKKKDCPRAIAVGCASLEEAAHPIETRIRMLELKEGIRTPNVLLLNETVDGEITDEVVLKLREMAHTDVFAFLRQELARRQHDLDHLRDRLEATGEEKASAAMIDDVKTIERCSYEELSILEKMLEKMREQLDEVFNANGDIDAFVEGYEATRDANEILLRRLEEENAEAIANLSSDMDLVMRKKEERLTQEANDIEIHKTFTLDSNAAIQAVHREQTENWRQILELVDVNIKLANERERLVKRHLEEHATDCRRRAVVDAWIEGCEQYQEKCEQARNVLEATTKWLDALRNFNNRMLDEVEKKTIHEEAFITRVQEQLEYLDIYRTYRTYSDEMVHRKEVRANALQRIARNLDLQIKESQVTLDPHKQKYIDEKAVAEKDHEEAKATVQGLADRALREKKFWQPIEDQLEEAQVEFDPPDMRADKTKVERRAQVVSRARTFLAGEQEHVDRDALNLRKLATTNAMLAKNHEKKRATLRASQHEGGESDL